MLRSSLKIIWLLKRIRSGRLVDAKAKVERIEPKDYVPNAAQTDRTIERIYSFFNTNKKIVQSDYNEDEWNAYYEAEIEPEVVQMHQTYTTGIFTRKERGFGNRIEFEANNLLRKPYNKTGIPSNG